MNLYTLLPCCGNTTKCATYFEYTEKEHRDTNGVPVWRERGVCDTKKNYI